MKTDSVTPQEAAGAGSSPSSCSPLPESPGTLRGGEPHPAAHSALEYVATLPFEQQMALQESFSSCAIEGNRFAEVCSETLRRVMCREPVSDRYILGLAWAIRGMDSSENDQVQELSGGK